MHWDERGRMRPTEIACICSRLRIGDWIISKVVHTSWKMKTRGKREVLQCEEKCKEIEFLACVEIQNRHLAACFGRTLAASYARHHCDEVIREGRTSPWFYVLFWAGYLSIYSSTEIIRSPSLCFGSYSQALLFSCWAVRTMWRVLQILRCNTSETAVLENTLFGYAASAP